MNIFFRFLCALVFALALSCSDKKDDSESSSKKSYDFSVGSSVSIAGSSLGLNINPKSKKSPSLLGVENLCTDDQPNLTCIAPSSLTGIYYSVGLLIQANGSGMLAYMLDDEWSAIDGSSESYAFDAANPTVVTGDLTCCGGSGNLTGENVYFSNVSYMFGYLDATFKIPYSDAQKSTVSDAMEANHTVRFVLVDDAITGYKLGDLLYKDTDGTFKWSDSSGTLSTTRPDAPITMNSEVVNWENPFDGGNDKYPVIYTEVGDGDEKLVTSEDELMKEDVTYTFDFDTQYFVALMIGQDSLSQVQTVKDLLSAMHIQGLPHTDFTFGVSGASELTIE